MAELYRAQNKFAEVEPLGVTYPGTAYISNNLAGLYYAQGKRREAKPLLKQALAIREQSNSWEPPIPDTAYSLNNLAGFYCVQGKYTEMELLLKRELAICG